jgi:hypothetical protein
MGQGERSVYGRGSYRLAFELRPMRTILVCALLLVSAAASGAENVWVLRGRVRHPPCPASRVLIWNADALLHNTTDATVVVRAVEVSNAGSVPVGEIAIPARSVRGVARTFFDFADAPVWLTKLEIPAGVVVEGRLEYWFNDCSLKPQPENALGKSSAPIFRELVPAGKATLFPGVDLGNQDIRVNAGIYNAADVPANARIEVYRSGCPSAAPSLVTVAVPARSLIQTSIRDLPPFCTETSSVAGSVAHAVVTVDQPSFSFVSSLVNGADPIVSSAISR